MSAERKVVTVLFTDVTESTKLADRLDAEELREVMGEWFAAVRAEIEAQGGTVEKYIGDAVMAVFGVPTAHEDDPARALRAALALRHRLVEVNDRLGGAYGVTMQIRTGINTGDAVASPNPAPGEALVTGVAVNAAARLEQLAEPGQIVVAERTARAAPGFRFEDLGDRELRGKEEPVRAFLLLEETPDAPTRGLPGVHAPLVGRDRELDLLLALHDRVDAERRPHLVTIYGEPGVGKSRLVRELLARLRARPDAPRVVVGRCLSYGEGITYWPLAEILKSLAGVGDADSTETALARIRALADGMPPLTFPALAFTLGLDAGDDELARLQPSALRVELHRAWRTLLSTLAERTPVVAVVDDIHWADAELLDLLEEIAERAQGALLLVCPARPELTNSRPTWGGGRRNFSSVFLSPLPEEAAAELVSHLLDVDGLPDATRAQILGRAEGNPFFLEEILRQLIDEGRIVRADGRWRATDELARFELPDTVQGVLAARIDLLRPREKRTLQHASVVGRVFWRGAVAALVDDVDALDPDLRRLEERELVSARVSSTIAGEEELSFSHILTRDVAYESLPRRERPRAHARVARWIEDTAGDRRREYGALLAHHYSEAYRGARRDRSYPPDELETLRRRAFDLLLLAAENAARGAAYRAARSLAESAVEVAETPEERASAYEALARCNLLAALGDQAYDAFVRAVGALREGGSTDHDRIGRLSGLALETVLRWAGTNQSLPPEEDAAAILGAALEHLDPADSEAHVRLLTAQSFWAHGYPTTTSPLRDPVLAEQTGRGAAEMALRLGRPELAVVALDSVQHNLQRRLRLDDAHQVALERLDLAKKAGDLAELGDSYAVAAWNSSWVGLFEAACALGREAYDLLVGVTPLFAAHAISWSAYAAFYLGDWDRALEEHALLVAALGERGEQLTSGFASPWPGFAFIHEARGSSDRADELLREVASIERVSGGRAPNNLRLLLLRGEVAEARDLLDRAFAADRGRDNLPFLRHAEAELLLAEERWDELPPFAASVRELGRSSGALYLAPTADRLDGRVAIAAGAHDDGVRLLLAAAAGYDALSMRVDAAVARLDAAETLAGEEARALAEAARAALEPTRFRRELDRAARILDA
ncbi:MAG TPA: AAA family ATPase [Gaiellaceae bacterium]